ncbi:MAG: hypothetical protein Q8M20_04090 [Rhodocyclaceae bacterium]|nr:hypothetical protein [Rhodocyclaceae bacterium]MDZ4213939.1 hypothetical protein [Rhodocyclaceae bacterium]
MGVLVALVILEGVLLLLPVSSGARMAETDQVKPFSHYLPQQHYTYSLGWSLLNARRGMTNDQGFTNSPDFSGQGGVLVVGDSFIESLMLDLAETVQGRLGTALGGNVVAAASSGNGLADSLKLAEFYLPRLRPRALVIFVKHSELSSLTSPPHRGHNGFDDEGGVVAVRHNVYQESPLKQIVQKSALARYLYYNLKFPDWVSKAVRVERPSETSAPTVSPARKEKMLNYYFSELQQWAGATQLQILFLIDGDRESIYSGQLNPKAVRNKADREIFLRVAPTYGHGVVDLQPVFERHWSQRRERMDFMPADGHWNPVAHQLAAVELLKHLKPAEAQRGN